MMLPVDGSDLWVRMPTRAALMSSPGMAYRPAVSCVPVTKRVMNSPRPEDLAPLKAVKRQLRL